MSAQYDPHSHAQMAPMLARYEFGCLSPDERRAFETHLLTCDRCFAELARGNEVRAAMQAAAPRLLAALDREPRLPGRLRWRWPRGARLDPRALWPRVALPAAIALLILLVGVRETHQGRDLRELATFPRQGIAESARRGAVDGDGLRELLIAGSGYLETGRYEEAEQHLRAALERNPESATAAYLLGLCLALEDRANDALPHLRSAVAGADASLRPAALWLLGNAYLKEGHMPRARAALEALAAKESRYRAAAIDLLRSLAAD